MTPTVREVKCNICGIVIMFFSWGSYRPIDHLRTHHPEDYERIKSEIVSQNMKLISEVEVNIE